MAPELDPASRATWERGRALFETQFVATEPASSGRRPGLGPLFNATSCASCHIDASRAKGPAGDGSLPIGVVIHFQSSGDPRYGRVLNTTALPGVAPEGRASVHYSEISGYYYPFGGRWTMRVPHYRVESLTRGPIAPDTVVMPRIAPSLFGVGSLERVPESVLRHMGNAGPGRFGWQSSTVSIRDQSATALATDIGITSQEYPHDDCTDKETDCKALTRAQAAEIDPAALDDLVFFQRNLPALTVRPGVEFNRGLSLFESTGCADCHRPRLSWRDAGGAADIAPFSDLSLHDLGPEMADETISGRKVISRWRTAPLWGMRLRLARDASPTFLHDGRARTLEEAVLWHFGEGARAKRQFTLLGPNARTLLLDWIAAL